MIRRTRLPSYPSRGSNHRNRDLFSGTPCELACWGLAPQKVIYRQYNGLGQSASASPNSLEVQISHHRLEALRALCSTAGAILRRKVRCEKERLRVTPSELTSLKWCHFSRAPPSANGSRLFLGLAKAEVRASSHLEFQATRSSA